MRQRTRLRSRLPHGRLVGRLVTQRVEHRVAPEPEIARSKSRRPSRRSQHLQQRLRITENEIRERGVGTVHRIRAHVQLSTQATATTNGIRKQLRDLRSRETAAHATLLDTQSGELHGP